MKKALTLFIAFTAILFTTAAFADEGADDILAAWQMKYGDPRLWDYRVNAAYAEQASWMYAWNPSMRPVLPDQDAISAEAASELACHFIPLYGCDIKAEDLASLACIVSSYRKPADSAASYWSSEGTWVIDFWDTLRDEPVNICTIYIDAHTGIPSALLLPSGIQYIGAPDNAILICTEG